MGFAEAVGQQRRVRDRLVVAFSLVPALIGGCQSNTASPPSAGAPGEAGRVETANGGESGTLESAGSNAGGARPSAGGGDANAGSNVGGASMSAAGLAQGGESAGGNRASGGGGNGNWTVTTCAGNPPSCTGLAHTCGPTGTGDCCESNLVPGGTYLRDNYISEEATVSTFCLDKYEITVGRFRQFLAAYPDSKPSVGAGKNPNSPSDPGWDANWDVTVPTAANVTGSCSPYRTWTATPGEHEAWPMNCLLWYYAYAFCAWDGGWLPTRVEWDYAARGGADQRYFPWSVPASDRTVDKTYASYDCKDCGAWVDILAVGSKPKGDGRFGQSDLIGNVMEWVKDWHRADVDVPCVECADYDGGTRRDLRGGHAASYPQNIGSMADQTDYTPDQRWGYIGARCARMP